MFCGCVCTQIVVLRDKQFQLCFYHRNRTFPFFVSISLKLDVHKMY